MKEPGQNKCVLCTFHHRDCTYLDEPQRRKRKRLETGAEAEADAPPDRDDRCVVYLCSQSDLPD